MFVCFFFFNDTATTEIYTLSLHDALPILQFDFGYFLMPGTQRSLTLPDAVYQRMHQVAAGGMVNLRLMAATSPRLDYQHWSYSDLSLASWTSVTYAETDRRIP